MVLFISFGISLYILTAHAIASECDTSFYYRDRHSGGQSRIKRRLKWGLAGICLLISNSAEFIWSFNGNWSFLSELGLNLKEIWVMIRLFCMRFFISVCNFKLKFKSKSLTSSENSKIKSHYPTIKLNKIYDNLKSTP